MGEPRLETRSRSGGIPEHWRRPPFCSFQLLAVWRPDRHRRTVSLEAGRIAGREVRLIGAAPDSNENDAGPFSTPRDRVFDRPEVRGLAASIFDLPRRPKSAPWRESEERLRVRRRGRRGDRYRGYKYAAAPTHVSSLTVRPASDRAAFLLSSRSMPRSGGPNRRASFVNTRAAGASRA